MGRGFYEPDVKDEDIVPGQLEFLANILPHWKEGLGLFLLVASVVFFVVLRLYRDGYSRRCCPAREGRERLLDEAHAAASMQNTEGELAMTALASASLLEPGGGNGQGAVVSFEEVDFDVEQELMRGGGDYVEE
uniref:Uncharacterized protein n=1 Tax=Florenciella parvula TaxID=236787 RepID=A0A7S2BGU3_9STRA|mmetsp:Transcript_16668/g.34835  ORF Transcript_16668/g.34835 Transcript_16668/m.34835 type:complete len:134 (+) Transcript_16668:159-560(+)|eukprot:CAMPEP_0182539234 /NCGR_PEP_ID=MMETSP1323-20130603/25027_1 /TAXON_ID=236787 /ORGANISM="Florenciella parvula, Strain RCC1693" /LENGTH=133 /DNA_ID=CAMNT_0024749777 /DNA_START=159 /DNA_END=560 /DNA_ORIENTATION=-